MKGELNWQRHMSLPAMMFAVLLVLVHAHTGLAQITNTVIANGSFGGGGVLATADESVSVEVATPSMTLVKNGVYNDDDGTPGLSAGDSVYYTVSIENTGNISLTNPVVSDPSVTLTYLNGDTDTSGTIGVNETWVYAGSKIITQGELDTNGGGDGDIDNTAEVKVNELPSQSASHELVITPVSSVEFTKQSAPLVQLFPYIYEITYTLEVENTGSLTQTNISVIDDLVAAINGASLHSAPVVSASGFAGTGGVNLGYNGTGNNGLLSGDVQLAPLDSGVITLIVQINTNGALLDVENTAYVDSDQITSPIPSDDPSVTSGNTSDTNPTDDGVPDSDGDGTPDADEGNGDRDGDLIPDSADYDPTGYFYCQENGAILSDGLISVTNVLSGGTQTGLGTSNDITIWQDGSNGYYQFTVSAAGTYELSYALPSSGVASVDRTSLGNLDATSFLPADPAVIGSSEFGASGELANYSAVANPFYTVFEIEAGDPNIFSNNIPLSLCGDSAITAEKEIVSQSEDTVIYRLTATSSGTGQVNDVQISDDLASVFGAGNYVVENLVIDSAPIGFGATTNAGFNGNGDIGTLTSGGTLLAGESVSVLLQVSTSEGTYTNSMMATGITPITNTTVSDADDSPSVVLVEKPSLLVEKFASSAVAPLGSQVVYTIRVTNNGATNYNNVSIVDAIPNGMSYMAGSALVDGVAIEPDASFATNANELVWPGLNILASTTREISVTLMVNASAKGRKLINNAFVRDASNTIVSNIAKVSVEIPVEAVFECSDLIGRVFDDANRNGYFDEGERGLAGVRLATVKGLLIKTDKFGRFHIACGAIPDADIGSNFIIKLDERTLPAGYKVITENPRVVRLTRGKLTKLNFGAAAPRIVRVELNDASFITNSNRLTKESIRALGSTLGILDDEPSILKVVVTHRKGEAELMGQRISSLQALIKSAWDSRIRANKLVLELKMQAKP
ncbi:MAG: hypothetical protein AB8B49_04895 [Nitratireductor sp.]